MCLGSKGRSGTLSTLRPIYKKLLLIPVNSTSPTLEILVPKEETLPPGDTMVALLDSELSLPPGHSIFSWHLINRHKRSLLLLWWLILINQGKEDGCCTSGHRKDLSSVHAWCVWCAKNLMEKPQHLNIGKTAEGPDLLMWTFELPIKIKNLVRLWMRSK